MQSAGPKCGGFTNEQPMDADMHTLIMAQKGAIEAKLGKGFTIFVPVSYQSQVVAGLNHKVRIAVNGGQSIYADLYEALPCAGGSVSVTNACLY